MTQPASDWTESGCLDFEGVQAHKALVTNLKNDKNFLADCCAVQSRDQRCVNVLHRIASFKSLIEAKSIIGLSKSALWDAIQILVKEAVTLNGEKKARQFLMQPEEANGSSPLHLACS